MSERGCFWVGVGYAILYNFWVYTEVVKRAHTARTRVLESLPPNEGTVS